MLSDNREFSTLLCPMLVCVENSCIVWKIAIFSHPDVRWEEGSERKEKLLRSAWEKVDFHEFFLAGLFRESFFKLKIYWLKMNFLKNDIDSGNSEISMRGETLKHFTHSLSI